MSAQAELRRGVARRLAEAVDLGGVGAIAIVGSVARGHADALSDLELLLVWTRPPADSERDALLSAWGGRPSRRYTRSDPWFGVDNLEVRGFPVDVVHHTVDGLEALERLALADADLAHQEVLANLVAAEVLAGGLRRPVYPEGLAARTLQRHVAPLPLGSLLLPAARGDAFRAHDRRLAWVRAVAIALHAVNGLFWPGDRALLEVLGGLPVQPPAAAERARRALEAPVIDAVPDLLLLVQQTLELAVERVAGWDGAARLARLPSSSRCRWTEDDLGRWLVGEAPRPTPLR